MERLKAVLDETEQALGAERVIRNPEGVSAALTFEPAVIFVAPEPKSNSLLLAFEMGAIPAKATRKTYQALLRFNTARAQDGGYWVSLKQLDTGDPSGPTWTGVAMTQIAVPVLSATRLIATSAALIDAGLRLHTIVSGPETDPAPTISEAPLRV